MGTICCRSWHRWLVSLELGHDRFSFATGESPGPWPISPERERDLELLSGIEVSHPQRRITDGFAIDLYRGSRRVAFNRQGRLFNRCWNAIAGPKSDAEHANSSEAQDHEKCCKWKGAPCWWLQIHPRWGLFLDMCLIFQLWLRRVLLGWTVR